MNRSHNSPSFFCAGFQAGELMIPPFEVGPGEIVKIVFPPQYSREMHLAEQALCRSARQSGAAESVELAMQPARWKEFFHRQTAAEWLITNCDLTHAEAIQKLQDVEVPPDAVLSQLAGTPRWLIGFIAAMHRRPQVLVFTTTGCDPAGIQRALSAVSAQLPRVAAVYLSCFSGLTIAEPDYSTVLDIQSFARNVA